MLDIGQILLTSCSGWLGSHFFLRDGQGTSVGFPEFAFARV